MEMFLSNIEWAPVLVSTVVAFFLGWLWYSPKLFVKKWQEGLPTPPKWEAPMWMPMSAQLGSTFFLAIIVNMALAIGHTIELTLITFTIMGFIKANGMYCGKNKVAISIEVLYILVMVMVMVGVNYLM